MQTFPIVDDLFRWSGPAFLAITNRPGGLLSLHADVMKVTSHRIEENIVVGNREVLLPIASSALTLQLFREPDMGGLIQKLDGFTKSLRLIFFRQTNPIQSRPAFVVLLEGS